MTQKELIGKIKAEIERRIDYIKSFKIESDRHTGLILELTDLLSFIESLEQSIDADKMIGLDEAAKGHPDYNTYYEEHQETFVEGFKAEAKWMAEQGETHELTVECPVLGPPMICCPVNANSGDKVIVQIRRAE